MEVDWHDWASRWDHFQECYVPQREAQVAHMLDHAEQWCRARPLRALDLCSGPGTIADRLLGRLPDAHVVALDGDAWLLELGRRSTSGVSAWIEADVREAGWSAAIPTGSLHAVFAMTALHWLDHETLARVYVEVARLLLPDGLLLNADLIPAGDAGSTIGALGRERLFRWHAEQTRAEGGIDWGTFWSDAHAEPAFTDLLEQRDRRLGMRPGVRAMSAAGHVRALRSAGFRDAAEIWRRDAAAILAAVR
jgi:SAM-dependent methyltransferase